jgi:hypothetical protein
MSAPVDVTGDANTSQERERLRGVLKPLHAYDGGMIWDAENQALTIKLTSDSAIAQARTLIGSAASSLRVNFARVQYTEKELDDLANKLLSNQVQWAGAAGIGGGYDAYSNRVLLQVYPGGKDAAKLIRAVENLKDPRVALELVEGVDNWKPETRVADIAPWTTGARIHFPNDTTLWCTLGWAWRLWSNNAIVGSTARHCENLVYYNNGKYVGTVNSSREAVDSAFMSSSGGYSPSVFVGSQTTADYRPVVGVVTSWAAGTPVAMSGATSGLTVSTVRFSTYTLPYIPECGRYQGLVGVLMWDHFTSGGDSGGPWLTTQSGTGNAFAHGQHFGFGCAAGYAGAFFVKLSAISSAQQASLLTY